MKTIYKLYQNREFNPLLLNLISVRYANTDCIDNSIVSTKDYSIILSNVSKQFANDSITLKLMLYLCSMLTECGLNQKNFSIPTSKLKEELVISKTYYIDMSLHYLSSISYEYQFAGQRYYTNILTSYEHKNGRYKVEFDEYLILLLNRNKWVYTIPKNLLKCDVRYYKHCIFLGNYLYLHQKINYTKKNKYVISIRQLLKVSPLIPSYDELPKDQRQVQRSIIKPFEKNLSYICNLLNIEWQYTDEMNNQYESFITNKIIIDCR